MLSKNSYYYINCSKTKLLKKNNNILYKIKIKILERINSINRDDYLKLFIIGDNSSLDPNILNSYRINGISHLFSVSGMHISLLSTILLVLFNRIFKKYNYIMVIIFLLFYMFLTNFTPSVVRATLLFILLLINKILKLNIDTYKILLHILSIVLFINPYNIYNIGFIFSYSITLSLIIFSNIINKKNNYFKKLFLTSTISFLISIPILINNYFSVNIMTILNNLIFVPFVSFIIFPFSLLVLLIPKLSIIYTILITILEKLSIYLINFKIEIVLCKINIIFVLLYYLLIIFIILKINNNKYHYILFLIVVLTIHTNINYIKNNTFITFLDVEQGDSSLIHLPHNNSNILIDTGGNIYNDVYKDIINYLKSEGIKHIDYLILTHGDYDHMGEAINLVNNFKVEKVIFNCGPYNDLEKDLIKVLDKKKIPYYSCIKELNIDNNKLYFLNNGDYGNENDNSSVIYTELNNHKFLFMGDAGVEVEEDLIEKYNLKNIDILKVGHHGSKTSSSQKFIETIEPKYSIISVGKNNRYGHPNKEVLNNLKNSKIYRTDQDGSIMFKIKNNKLEIETCAS